MFVDACAALAGLGFGAVVASVVITESHGSLAAPGGLPTAAGRLAAFTGTYLILIMVVLVARLPWLERTVGQDQLVRWHRKVAPWALGLITAHVLLTTIGYAQAARSPVLSEGWILIRSYPDILAASAGFGLLLLAGIASYRAVRRRLRYETWWVVHLYLYLGLALAFAHQIVTGASFIGHPLVRALWIAVWVATAGMVMVFRIGQPGMAQLVAPAQGRRGAQRGTRRRLADLPRTAPGTAAGLRRPVLHVAIPHPRAVVAGTSIFAVGAAAAALPASHGQGLW